MDPFWQDTAPDGLVDPEDGACVSRRRLGAFGFMLWVVLALLVACGQEEPDTAGLPDGHGDPDPATRRFRSVLSTRRFDVVGGVPATAQQYPASGVLLYAVRGGGSKSRAIGAMLCSGSLVAPDVVLAAAHCQEPNQGHADLYFSLSDDVSDLVPHVMRVPEDAVRVAHFESHPNYRRSARTRQVGQVNDVALMYLDHAIDVPPARVPRPSRAHNLLHEGRPVVIVGYGRRSEWQYGGGDDGKKMCGDSTLSELGAFELEIGRVERDAFKCFGDSGGPTYAIDSDGRAWMIGITSRGASVIVKQDVFGNSQGACRTGSIDTRTDPYWDWIDASMRRACHTPLRPACSPAWEGLPGDSTAQHKVAALLR